MEAVRQVVNSGLLDGIISLPETLKGKEVELVVYPVETKPKTMMPKFTRKELDEMLEGSITQSLIGILSNDDEMKLEDYRAERLKKYETIDCNYKKS